MPYSDEPPEFIHWYLYADIGDAPEEGGSAHIYADMAGDAEPQLETIKMELGCKGPHHTEPEDCVFILELIDLATYVEEPEGDGIVCCKGGWGPRALDEADLGAIASYVGTDRDALVEAFTSSDPVELAWAYQIAISYFGLSTFGGTTIRQELNFKQAEELVEYQRRGEWVEVEGGSSELLLPFDENPVRERNARVGSQDRTDQTLTYTSDEPSEDVERFFEETIGATPLGTTASYRERIVGAAGGIERALTEYRKESGYLHELLQSITDDYEVPFQLSDVIDILDHQIKFAFGPLVLSLDNMEDALVGFVNERKVKLLEEVAAISLTPPSTRRNPQFRIILYDADFVESIHLESHLGYSPELGVGLVRYFGLIPLTTDFMNLLQAAWDYHKDELWLQVAHPTDEYGEPLGGDENLWLDLEWDESQGFPERKEWEKEFAQEDPWAKVLYMFGELQPLWDSDLEHPADTPYDVGGGGRGKDFEDYYVPTFVHSLLNEWGFQESLAEPMKEGTPRPHLEAFWVYDPTASKWRGVKGVGIPPKSGEPIQDEEDAPVTRAVNYPHAATQEILNKAWKDLGTKEPPMFVQVLGTVEVKF